LLSRELHADCQRPSSTFRARPFGRNTAYQAKALNQRDGHRQPGRGQAHKADGTMVQVAFVKGAPNARNSVIVGSRLNPSMQAPCKRRCWFQETER
jgi:hypothetical protein